VQQVICHNGHIVGFTVNRCKHGGVGGGGGYVCGCGCVWLRLSVCVCDGVWLRVSGELVWVCGYMLVCVFVCVLWKGCYALQIPFSQANTSCVFIKGAGTILCLCQFPERSASCAV
jgi:hypothetical protein